MSSRAEVWRRRAARAAAAIGRGVHAAWAWLDPDARTVQFYGGLVLVAFAEGWRLPLVGGVLVLHAVVVPIVVGAQRGGAS